MHTPYFSTNLSIANARIRFATAGGVVSARITASTSPLFASFCQSLRRTSSCSADSSLLRVRIAAASSYKGASLQQHARKQSQVWRGRPRHRRRRALLRLLRWCHGRRVAVYAYGVPTDTRKGLRWPERVGEPAARTRSTEWHVYLFRCRDRVRRKYTTSTALASASMRVARTRTLGISVAVPNRGQGPVVERRQFYIVSNHFTNLPDYTCMLCYTVT